MLTNAKISDYFSLFKNRKGKGMPNKIFFNLKGFYQFSISLNFPFRPLVVLMLEVIGIIPNKLKRPVLNAICENAELHGAVAYNYRGVACHF